MSVDALRLRRARRAIYGPPVVAFVGLALIVAGVIGWVVTQPSSHTVPVPAAPAAPGVTIEQPRHYALVDANGRIYPGSGNGTAPLALHGATIVGAARTANGAYWLVTNGGHVIGLSVASQGEHAWQHTVGIAASSDGGYWTATADGHVFAFGTSADGDLLRVLHTPVVGIAAAPHGGYWLAASNGRVYAFGGAPALGSIPSPTTIVGIAASPSGGYWLATASGKVYAFGAPAFASVRLPARVVAIGAAPDGGYWQATSDGRVYGFGAPLFSGATNHPAHVVAVVPA